MPIIKSAKKAARQATKRTAKNVAIKKDIKAALKAFKADPSAENMKKIQSEYDKAVKKGLLKKNTASRRKARVARLAKELSVAKPAKKASAKKTVAKKPAAKKATTKKA
ncbi:30S ribosomal protein S20 [Candidatus Saccharibacteria bacterium]|nr:30S ribosomal protein S20 [Candidatus Saccharibacteria bacterium]